MSSGGKIKIVLCKVNTIIKNTHIERVNDTIKSYTVNN